MSENTTQNPFGYVLEWKPGDQVFYTYDEYQKEKFTECANVHELLTTPLNPDDKPYVHYGRFWIMPKYVSGLIKPDQEDIPLYLGRQIHKPKLSEEVVRLFPSLKTLEEDHY